MAENLSITDPQFWQLPLDERMRLFGELREAAPFTLAQSPNPLTGVPDDFYAVTRMADVIEISRRATDFCSGKGAVSIADMPTEAMEFFGFFIAMDDPRHARQRGIVARSFTPPASSRASSTRWSPSSPRSSTECARKERSTWCRPSPSRSRSSSSAT